MQPGMTGGSEAMNSPFSPYKGIYTLICENRKQLEQKEPKYMEAFLRSVRLQCIEEFDKIRYGEAGTNILPYEQSAEEFCRCVITFWNIICKHPELYNIRYVLRLINFMAFPLGVLPQKVKEFIEGLSDYEREICRQKLESLPFKNEEGVVGLSGDEKYISFILDTYKKEFGDIRARLVYIATEDKNINLEDWGIDTIDVSNIEQAGVSEIIACDCRGRNTICEFIPETYSDKCKVRGLCDNDSVVVNISDPQTYDHPIIRGELKKLSDKFNFYIIDTPEHTNVGDYMITYAEEQFCRQFFPEYNVIEYSGKEYAEKRHEMKKNIKPYDIITVTGGGFLGSLWTFSANILYRVVEDYPKNRVVVFPQSIYFEENQAGIDAKKNALQILSGHDGLTICVRENISFEYSTKMFGRKLSQCLIPDMVLLFPIQIEKRERKGVMLCLRNDKESSLNLEQKDKIKKFFKEKYAVTEGTMHWPHRIANNEKEQVIQAKLQEISSKELVITDTLHCMISCAISQTPCVAMNNLSRKVEGCFCYFQGMNAMRYVDSIDELLTIDYDQLMKCADLDEVPETFDYYRKQLVSLFRK